MILQIQSVSKSFGAVRVLDSLTFDISAGEAVCLVGPNGTGKTTLFNLITGIIPCDSGVIKVLGENVSAQKPHMICRRGLTRTFQEIRLFPSLSVLDNIAVSTTSAFSSPSEARRAAEKSLMRLDLSGVQEQLTTELSTGFCKAVELARALAPTPRIMLLDEPFSALSPQRRDLTLSILLEEKQRGTALLIVEHIFEPLLELCDRMLVLKSGRIWCQGQPKDVIRSSAFDAAYLGTHSVTT